MLFIGNDRKIRKFGQEGEPDSWTRLSPVSRPAHCGDAVQLTMHTAGGVLVARLERSRAGSALRVAMPMRIPPGSSAGSEKTVWAAAAAVEACQWEMDHAVQQLACRSSWSVGQGCDGWASCGMGPAPAR